MPYKILLIEDDPLLRRELKILLENALYQVIVPTAFPDAAQAAVSEKADLVLLDINLPGCSGFDLCTQIRARSDIPVIFLTCRTASMDELTGLLKGADDYITKPFEPALLLARIGAVLKRSARQGTPLNAPSLQYKDVKLTPAACRLFYREQSLDLTKTEMKILHLLFAHAGNFVARADLVEYLWENPSVAAALYVHVRSLRLSTYHGLCGRKYHTDLPVLAYDPLRLARCRLSAAQEILSGGSRYSGTYGQALSAL